MEIAVDLISVARFTVRAHWHSLGIFVLSLAMQFLNLLCIVLIARALGATAPALMLGAVAVPVLVLSMLPISFAGWGLREAAMVTGLGLLDIPASVALTTSVGFGLSLLLASLPGLICAGRARFAAACPAAPQQLGIRSAPRLRPKRYSIERLKALVVTSINAPNAVMRSLASGATSAGFSFIVIGDCTSPADFPLRAAASSGSRQRCAAAGASPKLGRPATMRTRTSATYWR